MTFKPHGTYVIHNIIDPRPVKGNGPERPFTLVKDSNSGQTKWIITHHGDNEQYHIRNASTDCYAHLKEMVSRAVIESHSPLTRWKIKVISPVMYRIYDPVTQLFWTSHPESNEIYLEPFSPGSDQWWAISSDRQATAVN
ncbi:hypothetical protein Agabi119p4_6699 [Agaricus bisporus var. burnettii]|uniref:Uncharacterized protein n=1 Tax=Agaricus bisporus var. burnettii TaxID=192524 RepID=A0A8H7F044_AGABI|nr:hypothetical protein AGABI2DRAFT_119085 [Agaricus bisporus var. bisporus H97]EKV46909.1 hypothetical protein AGABI2DRAFT_119085 [Agaricus bisporus var. bisporus H97]KAF7770725.1 hypothetical protein Agabi119p4_6699 [Agaricus bisporus var. burnettii]